MIFINQTTTNPLFNIAAEEFTLKHFSEDVLMLWQSERSVIVGKHQNLVAEVNLHYTRTHNIPVIRRLSGGGTVFHDPGNINYTLIQTKENRNRLIDFKRFSAPVIEFLKTFGIQADIEGKNNLVINGKKFSGNSAHVFKNRVIHHGTLLFNTNIDQLEKVIRPSKAQISDKSVKSVRATVMNIADALYSPMSISEFKSKLTTFLKDYYQISRSVSFSKDDVNTIKVLIEKKYATIDWNYGYSPAYEFENRVDDAELYLTVKKGVIEQIKLTGFDSSLAEVFAGMMHRYEDTLLLTEKLDISPAQKQKLLSLFGF